MSLLVVIVIVCGSAAMLLGGAFWGALRGQGRLSVLFCVVGALCLLWFLVRQVISV